MKKSILFLFSAFVLFSFVSCANKSADAGISVVNPIMPIHYAGGSQHIWLTDYLPALTGDEQLTIETDMSYQASNYTTLEFDLAGDNSLSTLTVIVDGSARYDIPILPKLPFKTGMLTTGCSENSIRKSTIPITDAIIIRNAS